MADSATTGEDRTTLSRLWWFFATACLLTWAVWIPLVLSRRGMLPFTLPAPLYFLGALGPMLAAVIHTWLHERRAGVGHLLSRLILWRVPLRWYAVALLGPLLAGVLGTMAVWVVSGDRGEIEISSFPPLAISFLMFMLLLPGEEVGWRGYALPRLQQSFSALRSSVILGLGWAIWHLPAFWFSGVFQTPTQLLLAFAAFVPFTIAASVLFTWIVNSTGGSVLLATMHHAAFVFAGFTNAALVSPVPYFVVFGLTLGGVACAVVWRCGAATLSPTGDRIVATAPLALDKGCARREHSP